MIRRILRRLPTRFQWAPHNLVAHPLSEVLFQVGLSIQNLGDRIHDATIPDHVPGQGRG